MRRDRTLFIEKEKKNISGALVYPFLLILIIAVVVALIGYWGLGLETGGFGAGGR